jgi:serine/threonine protein kinase
VADLFAGRFELIDPIGTGGAGTVWRAWDRRQQRLCAAKVLRQRDAGALLRFAREQGRRLDHPNVLSPYGWAADDDQALLAMDLVGGGAASSLIADFGPLPPRLAAELLRQLLGALDQIHSAGVVHRDVKPANLLLEATGTGTPVLRLSDFGIAIALGEPRLTVHGTVVGTPGYLAPEVLAGAAPSPGQDLYAAGVTGWQLLTGAEPPERGWLLDRPAGAAGPLWDLVAALTDPVPDRRTPSAAEALERLAAALAEPLVLPAYTADGELIEVFDQLPPLPATPDRPEVTPAVPEPGRSWWRSRRTVVAAVVVGALAVIGGVTASLLAGHGPGADPGVTPSATPSSTATPAETPGTPPTRAADPEIAVGGACGWQQAGDTETAADGARVECRAQGSVYRWVKVG